MKIQKRHVVGIIMLIPMLPFVIVGFVAFWLWLYANSGWAVGEISYDWLKEKVD